MEVFQTPKWTFCYLSSLLDSKGGSRHVWEESPGSPGCPGCRLSLGVLALLRMQMEGQQVAIGSEGSGGMQRSPAAPSPYLGNLPVWVLQAPPDSQRAQSSCCR